MKRKLLRSLGVVLSCGIALASLASCGKTKTPKKEGYNILWADEFNGKKLNENIWRREEREKGWTNNELQAYTKDEKNGFVRNGKFVIKAYEEYVGSSTDKDGDTSTYSSCKLRNQQDKAFMYGRIEVSAKTPTGYGLWPAIWMMPKDEDVYGQWPKCGEIDIMEVLCDNVTKAYGTIHYGEPHAEEQGEYTLSGKDTFANSFHTYAVEWTPGQIEWFIDGESYLVVNDWFTAVEGEDDKPYPAPFNQEFCIQINLAVGGNWPGNPTPGSGYIKNAEFEIDYVRVYQKDSYDTNVKKPEKTYRDPFEDGNYCKSFTEPLIRKNSEVGWKPYTANQGDAEFELLEGGICKITTTSSGTEDYSVQLFHTQMPFIKGKTYSIEFEIWADETRKVNEICIDGGDSAGWVRYWSLKDQTITTTEHKKYEYTYTMTEKSNNAARFEFNMGNTTSTATIYISNVVIKEVTTAA